MRYSKIVLTLAVLLSMLVGTAGPAGAALDPRVTAKVMPAVVQLGPLITVQTSSGTQLKSIGWGSGTIIDPKGYILTNNHVTDVGEISQKLKGKAGVNVVAGKLVVFFTKDPALPPTPAYIADVMRTSFKRDLAVVRISTDLSGQPVDPNSLSLPFIPLGNSETLNIATQVNVFGYPGIGGDTITYTSGNVSGFTQEEGFPGRAWIKTDATIAGGNSGGTAVDDAGNLIGVPTKGGAGAYSSQQNIVDCRPVTDTNGDGTLDSKDSCVPIGGFINSLRAVNVALPIIQEATGGQPANGGQPQGVRITGQVVDAVNSQPLPGASFIILKQGVTGKTFKGPEDIQDRASTDSQGRFTTTDPVPAGKYFVAVVYPGYQQVTGTLEVPANQTSNMDIGVLKLQQETR